MKKAYSCSGITPMTSCRRGSIIIAFAEVDPLPQSPFGSRTKTRAVGIEFKSGARLQKPEKLTGSAWLEKVHGYQKTVRNTAVEVSSYDGQHNGGVAGRAQSAAASALKCTECTAWH